MPTRRPRPWFTIAIVVAFAAALLPAMAPVSAASVVLSPVADAYVRSDRATSNYGSEAFLRVREGPSAYRSYLAFDIPTISQPLTSATLRLYSTDGSVDGGTVAAVETAWAEDSITWANAPVPGGAIGSFGRTSGGVWVELDVTAAIGDGGRVAFAIANSSSNSAYYGSRESATSPELVLSSDDPTASPSPSPSPSAGPSPSPSPSPGPGATSVIFTPTDDAQVRANSATRNYGTDATLRARAGSDAYRSFLRFEPAGLSGSIVSAHLRLYVTDGSPDGGAVHAVGSGWTETTITWSNAPALPAGSLGSYGEVVTGTWVELDVTPAVLGNGPVAFGIASTSTNSVYWSSREGADPPQLLVQVAGTPPPPPTAAFSAEPTSGTAPLTVAFEDVSTGNPTSWAWDFESDGTIDSTARAPVFTYTSGGSYSVTLTVANAGGSDTLTAAGLIVVGAAPPPDPTAVTLVGAGDIATCSSTRDDATAALVEGIPGTVVTLGDNVYPDGTAAQFADCYDPSWGRVKARTRPSVGNSDYGTPGASGYFGYFGAAAGDPDRGYYSYDVGGWHVVVLNSNCAEVGGCGAGSPQEQWLRADLAASGQACTLAYWHHPRWSSGGGSTGSVSAFWDALYEHGAEVVLNGHAHVYERFAPQAPSGLRDPSAGIRQFTVGTGGESLAAWGTTHPNSQLRQNTTDGVLELTLSGQGYGWTYHPVGGTFADSGFEYCH